MPHSFVCDLAGDPKKKIAVLKKNAGERGIRFVGSTSSGKFSGLGLKGDYKVHGKQVRVTIYSVPFLHTPQSVEAQIRGFLQG